MLILGGRELFEQFGMMLQRQRRAVDKKDPPAIPSRGLTLNETIKYMINHLKRDLHGQDRAGLRIAPGIGRDFPVTNPFAIRKQPRDGPEIQLGDGSRQ
jgi:hypothetical protein